MALLWKEEVTIKEILMSAFTIEAHVEDQEANIDWWFIGLYASCDNQVRAGDFNDIVSNDEKWSGNWRDERSFKDFKEFINGNQMIDIGFEGHPWTWCNNWDVEGEIKQRLDRGLCNYSWYQTFDQVKCRHMETYASDHSMIMIDTRPRPGKRNKRFYFEKRWLKREDIREVIRTAWELQTEGSRMFQVTKKIRNCRVALLKWKNSFQANSRGKIDQIKRQMSELKESDISARKGSIAMLKGKLKEAYREEEVYWSHKSRIQWLREGDKNTKFFHATVKGRRRRNRMNKLQREDGSWTESEDELSYEIADYYRKLLTSSGEGDLTEVLEGISNTITVEMNENLIKPVEEEEIKFALFSMSPEKAPGADEGFSSLLRQAAGNKRISGMRICRQGPSLTHLFFADDSLIFCKANEQQATELMRVLQVYATGSGQLINLDKSSILFSKNMCPHKKHQICQIMGNMQQVWRILTNPNLLVSKVMKAKYFPRSSIFECKIPNNASWIWRGLMAARKVVKQGVRKRVSNGRSTQIWEDRWIPDATNGRVTTMKQWDSRLHKVEDLIIQKRWNRNLVFQYFNKEDAERILSIPISLAGREDSYFWIHGEDGRYSVSSGYKVLVSNKERSQEESQREKVWGRSRDGRAFATELQRNKTYLAHCPNPIGRFGRLEMT
ncbi:uncharacterized protein [Coffea arabica]|uniref:Reverse transcriptase n=1 Tax=Coffea arabica TaxID=13443 RepID=A0ABM4UQM4_COFAR